MFSTVAARLPGHHTPSSIAFSSITETLEESIKTGNSHDVSLTLQETNKINSEVTRVVTNALMANEENSPNFEIKTILLQYLLDHTPFDINAHLQNGSTLLDVAVRNGDKQFVEYLLAKNADPTLLNLSTHSEISKEMRALLKISTDTETTMATEIATNQKTIRFYVPRRFRAESIDSTHSIESHTTTTHDELAAETAAYSASLLIDPTEIFNKDTQDFSKIISIRRSTLGSNGGVFFLTGKSGAIVALKLPFNPAAEFFAYSLADAFGFNTPQHTSLDTNSAAFKTLTDRIKTISLHTDCPATRESIADFKKQLAELPASSSVMVMDFLNGRSLADSQTRTEIFSPEPIFKSPEILRNFGENLVFDFLCCHRDRFGITGQENPGNIFLTSDFKYFIIDQSVSNIQGGAFDHFKEEFRQLLRAFSDDSDALARAPYIENIKNFIFKHSGIKVSASHERHIQDGIWAGIEKAASITYEGLTAIQTKYASINGIDKVNINGILEMANLCPSLAEAPTTTLTSKDISTELKHIGGDDAYNLRSDFLRTQQMPPPSPQATNQKIYK